jgi:hypothetical protein
MTNEVTVKGNTIFITYNGKKMVRSIRFIHYCESYGHNSKIYFDLNKPVIAPIGINELYEILPHDLFHHCHKRFIVHLAIMHKAYIVKETIWYEHINIPVSRLRMDDFIDNIDAFMNSEACLLSWMYLASIQIPLCLNYLLPPPKTS